MILRKTGSHFFASCSKAPFHGILLRVWRKRRQTGARLWVFGKNGHKTAAFSLRGERHAAARPGKKRMVFSDAHIDSGVKLRPALADKNIARRDDFAAEFFDAEAPARRVAAVP
jgi:hypothetical protein